VRKRELAAIYDELKRRQLTGEGALYLSAEALAFLRTEAARQPVVKDLPSKERSLPEKPVPARKATARKKAASASSARPEIEVPPPPQLAESTGDKVSRLAQLQKQLMEDPWCRSQLKPGKHLVFGTGDPDAAIFLCGEAPGAEEEIQGEPFVGPAGELLGRILQAMGLGRESVYIANVMKYRPPLPTPVGNRPPTVAEMTYCLPYLRAQLEIIDPQVVIGLGKTALDGLLGPDPKRRMTAIRGHWQEFAGRPLMPTFHPSYLLRNQSIATKRLVWEDMLAVMERVGLTISAAQQRYFQTGS
jgi:uracil-DNA glycosylase family 4